MLEGKIIVYSNKSSKVSNFIYSLLGFFPGLLGFKFAGSRSLQWYYRSIKQFGFPLKLYNGQV